MQERLKLRELAISTFRSEVRKAYCDTANAKSFSQWLGERESVLATVQNLQRNRRMRERLRIREDLCEQNPENVRERSR
jgi:hypothetical protein